MAAPKTVKTYPLAGTNRDFEIPFEYLARKFVIVTLIGTDRKELVLNVDYRFTQRTIITLTRVWGPEEGYNLIEIKRVTSATERLVDFSDGSILRASDLNTATVQALHIAEEGRDIATDTIGVDNNGQLDARGRQIKNLADGVDDGDAISIRQVKAYDSSALNSANRAAERANAANNSAISASGDAGRALTYRDQASASASSSAGSAATSASLVSQAAASADLARRWAAEDLDVIVANGRYSALTYNIYSMRYSIESGNSAAAALASKNAAAASASASAASAASAAASAAGVKLPPAGPSTALRVLSQNTEGSELMYSYLKIPLTNREVGNTFLKAGSFGVGGVAVSLYGADANANRYIEGGLYYLNAGQNTPYPYGYLRCSPVTPGEYDFQEAFAVDGKMYHRGQSGGVWGPWKPIRYGVYSNVVESFLLGADGAGARDSIGAAARGYTSPTMPLQLYGSSSANSGSFVTDLVAGDHVNCVVNDGSITSSSFFIPRSDGTLRCSVQWGNSGYVSLNYNPTTRVLSFSVLSGYGLTEIWKHRTLLT